MPTTSKNAGPAESAPVWHVLPLEAVFGHLESTPSGLSGAEASRRLAIYGPNELQGALRVSPWTLLLAQFKNVLIVILLVATVLSAFLGHAVEAVAIAVIVLFAVLLGFVQEYRADRAMQALRRMAAPLARVFRDDRETEIPARDLVPGDVILLQTGDKIPADVRLLEAINLQIEEAPLTGESVPVEKRTAPLADPESALGDRQNMAYAGTAATYGRGRAVVVATGMETEFGKIAQMLQTVQTGKTPLQVNLDKLGRTLAKAALVVVVAIVALGLWRGQPFIEMLIFGIALAVAVVPEALPAVVTISLAIGVQRMVKRHALMRRLPAVETLGSTSVICSDKTGTLTKDEMTVRQVFVAGQLLEVSGAGYEPSGQFSSEGTRVEPPGPLKRLLQAAALASDAHLVRSESEGRWQVQGDPTEGALVVAAAKAGLNKSDLDAQFPRVDEIPFSSETKRMTTLHAEPAGTVAYAKGAAEVILDSCTRQATAEADVALDAGRRETILEVGRDMASQALRVLAVAAKSDATRETAERDMTFLGLVGMIDPPRPEAKAAIQTCELAGIKPVMITGDHPLTAEAVARELGVLKQGRLVTGAELEAMSEAEFERAGGRHRSLCPRFAGPQVASGHRLAAARPHCRHDGRRGERRPRAQESRHRHRHGNHGHGRDARSRGDDAHGRQLRLDRGGGGRGPGHLRQHPEILDVSALVQRRRDRLDGRSFARGLPLAVECRPNPVRQSGHRRTARPGAGRRPAGTRSHAPPAPGSAQRRVHAPGRDPHAARRALVGAGQRGPFCLGAGFRPQPRRGHDHDVRFAGPDSVLQGVQLPLRPAFRLASSLCQQMAEHFDPVGVAALGRRRACALPARPVRYIQLDAGGLGDRHSVGLHGLARVGVSQVVRTTGLVW